LFLKNLGKCCTDADLPVAILTKGQGETTCKIAPPKTKAFNTYFMNKGQLAEGDKFDKDNAATKNAFGADAVSWLTSISNY
jgi:hypothetical protein